MIVQYMDILPVFLELYDIFCVTKIKYIMYKFQDNDF